MRRGFILLTIGMFLSGHGQAKGLWQEEVLQKPTGLHQCLEYLAKTPTGKALLLSAAKRDPAFRAHLHVGEFSLTESSLERNFELPSGREWVSVKQEITLNRNLRLADAILDLAHELTHFSIREPLNPYEISFVKNEFIRHGIEGKGGELDAFLSECRVTDELKQQFSDFPDHPLCKRYPNEAKRREEARRDFYRVGVIQDKDWEELKQSLPELTHERVVFRSAQVGLSYPLALSREFDHTLSAACGNNERRLKIIQNQASAAERGQRGPASLNQEADRIKAYQKKLCR